MIAANAGIQTIKLYLIKYIKKGFKMELSIKQKESIIKMFNEYLMQYKEAGIAHNEAVIFARHKTRQNASVMINTYFK